MKFYNFFLIAYLLMLTPFLYSQTNNIKIWNLKELYKTPKWKTTDIAKKESVTGILYKSMPYKNKETEVFAYYGVPKGEIPRGGWPAVVCVHGGGGTAFNQWVKKWNEQGYAAISMDLEGHYPVKDTINGKLQYVSVENPSTSRAGIFEDFNLPIKNQWYYNAVAHIVLANSLLRSFPEVNANKIGITGISWGGNLTSTVMGVDDRFKFAIPVYGCGFLPDSDSLQGNAIKLGEHTEVVYNNYDGSAYFSNVVVPTFWLNGTNDRHFALLSTQKSSQAVKGPVTLRYQKEMIHSHKHGWNPKEIYAFANSVLKNGKPLPVLEKPTIKRNKIFVEFKSVKEIEQATLFYTKDTGVWNKRKWMEAPATLKNKKIVANIPEEVSTIYIAVTDVEGLMVTSEFVEVK
jgi:dienelactone hydrolase